MTIVTLGSLLIILGIAVLAAGVALPVAHLLRLRAAARTRPVGSAHRAAAQRVSA